MRVKVRIKDRIADTGKAVLLLVSEQEIWFPKAAIRWGKGNYIICSQKLAEQKGIRYSPLLHIPDRIEPVYNQEAIDDLVC